MLPASARESLVRHRRHRQRQRGQPHQFERVVVAGGLVEAEPPAVQTAMNEDPAPFAANGDRDRLHAAGALGVPVTGSVAVEVSRPQALWAVIAIGGSGCVERDGYAAMTTPERTCESQSIEPFRGQTCGRTNMTASFQVVRIAAPRSHYGPVAKSTDLPLPASVQPVVTMPWSKAKTMAAARSRRP